MTDWILVMLGLGQSIETDWECKKRKEKFSKDASLITIESASRKSSNENRPCFI